ncbi:hypothetical protein ACTVZO_24380 [Streptomyces sp. IBSNAI002]|uniref:hypothetical protein n=1 Tax=Streptomyces sp. IBSNAI002 TaxID=3457500 RepID=UPI003FD3891F
MVAGRHIRLTAVLVAVVFALTGFSSNGGSSGGRSSVDVVLDDPSRAAEVRNCRLGKPRTSGSTASATPKATSGPTSGATSGGSKSTPAPKSSKSRKPR